VPIADDGKARLLEHVTLELADRLGERGRRPSWEVHGEDRLG
jgi:hypothetical protein